MLETTNSVLPCRFVEYLYLELIGSTFCYSKNGSLGLKREERVGLFWADHMVFKGKRRRGRGAIAAINRVRRGDYSRGIIRILQVQVNFIVTEITPLPPGDN